MKQLFTFATILLLALTPLAAQSGFNAPSGPHFASNLSVFPNPSTNGIFKTQFDNDNFGEVIQIKVYNLIGRQVQQQQITSTGGRQEVVVRLNSLPKGVYMLELSNGSNRTTRRLSYF